MHVVLSKKKIIHAIGKQLNIFKELDIIKFIFI